MSLNRCVGLRSKSNGPLVPVRGPNHAEVGVTLPCLDLNHPQTPHSSSRHRPKSTWRGGSRAKRAECHFADVLALSEQSISGGRVARLASHQIGRLSAAGKMVLSYQEY